MDIERRIRHGVNWVATAATLVAVMDIVALLFLLRYWVTPRDLGIATLAVSLFPILDVLADLGFSSALVQRNERDAGVLSSVFWLNLALAGILLAGIVALAPLFGRFHGHPIVGSLLIAYGVKLFLTVGGLVPLALLRQELRFREVSITRVAANVTDVTLRLGFAAAGFPIWCFVVGQLGYAVVFVAGVTIARPWLPRLRFRSGEARSCLRYGLTISTGQFLTQFFSNIDYQIVGRVFGVAALGAYRVAFELVLTVVHFITGVTVDVAFPSFARLKGQPVQLAAQFLRFARQNVVFTLPPLALIFICANDLLALFFPRYSGAAAAVRVLCFVGMVRAMSLVWVPLLNGVGSPSSTVRYAATAAVVLPALFVTAAATLGPHVGMISVALAWAAGYPIAAGVLASYGLRKLDLTWGCYLKSLAPVFVQTSLAMLPGIVLVVAVPAWPPVLHVAAVSLLCGASIAFLRRQFPAQ